MEKGQLTSVFMGLRQRLRSVARGIVGEQEADDALQEAFARLWQRSDSIPDSKSAEGISIVTVRHVAIDERRRQEQSRPFNSPLPPNPPNLPITLTPPESLFEEIKQLIFTRLDERSAKILWRRDYQQWSFGEIAEEHGTSEANVRQIVSRARKEIRELYRQQSKL